MALPEGGGDQVAVAGERRRWQAGQSLGGREAVRQRVAEREVVRGVVGQVAGVRARAGGCETDQQRHRHHRCGEDSCHAVHAAGAPPGARQYLY
jgi:hypothetical protein